MNTLSDLTDALEQHASRGTPRGADEVLAGARDSEPSTDRGGRRVQPFVAAVAVVGVCLVVGLAVLWTRGDDTSLVTTTAPVPPSSLASLTVEGGTVAVVGTGFDRIWVATRDSESLPAESHLRSFDPATGEELSETTLVGDVYRFALTGRYVWVRATSGGPASFPVGVGGLGDNAIYRVDPRSGEATPMRYLNGDGPLAGTESRIAAADASHIEIVGEDGQQIASATIDEAAGVPDAILPGTNRILGLAFAEGVDAPPAIYAILQGGRELLQLDPTGRHMAAVELADTADRLGPTIATAGDRVWIGIQPSGLIQVTVPLGDESEPSMIPTPVRSGQIHPLDDHQLLIGGGGVAAVLDLGLGGVTTTPLDSGNQTQLLVVDGRAWAAQWSAPEGATTRISFTFIENR